MLIELLVAVLIIAVGVLSLMTAFDSSRRLSSVGERQNTLAQAAEQQMEKILGLPYSQIALNANPSCAAYTGDPNNSPNLNVTGCSTGPFSYKYDGTHTETVIVDTTNGKVSPTVTQTTPAPSGGARLTLYVYSYVTATTDSLCSGCLTGSNSENFKRVTVAVDSSPSMTPLKNPMYVSSFAINPCAAAGTSNATCLVP